MRKCNSEILNIEPNATDGNVTENFYKDKSGCTKRRT